MAGVDRAKTPLDGRFMGLDVVDLFFNLNLPGFHSFKYGDDFIEFFVRSHNSFLFDCIQIPNAWVFAPYDIANFTLDQLLGTNQGGLLPVKRRGDKATRAREERATALLADLL